MDLTVVLLVVAEVAGVRRASYSCLDVFEGTVAEVRAWDLHANGVWIEEMVAWAGDCEGLVLSF